MEQAVTAGVLRGRPFGGVSIAWSHNLDHVINPVTNYRHKRVVSAEFNTANDRILLISVYMPFYDASNREECLAETIDALSMIDILIENHPDHLIIIGGDLNTQLKGDSPFDALWLDLTSKNRLEYCSRQFSQSGYTFRQEKLGQRKMLDHFIVSEKIILDNIISNHQILDEGDNLSDHLPILMQISVSIPTSQTTSKNTDVRPKLRWIKISSSQVKAYTSSLEQATDRLREIRDNIECYNSCHCESELCRYYIQQEYDDLIECLKIADAELPRQKPGTQKEWWCSELSNLKNQSVEIHNLWKIEGKPRCGPTFHECLRVRAAYKRAIRVAQKTKNQYSWNKVHDAMANDDTNNFWNSWRTLYSKNNSHFATVVDGCSDKQSIAEAFRASFEANSEPNDRTKVQEIDNEFKERYAKFSKDHNSSCDCNKFRITVEMVIDAICTMKSGKCADEDGVHAEHFQNAPLNFIQRITKLLNLLLTHSFVPKQFRFGYMLPIVKDSNGNSGDTSNYRGITISPMMTKVFEHVLKSLFSENLETNSLQFGFKKKNSTTHAIYCLKQTVDYYINNGSRVYCSFLDASKAFDRLVHSGLFHKMIERNFPKIFIDVIITWYDGLYCRVLWDGHYSAWFLVRAGVRQGGVLSPNFYGLYVDDLFRLLESSGVGCYYLKRFAAALMYADDLAVLAPSLKGLQRLLLICENYCHKWDIKLNAKKTKNLWFGKGSAPSFGLKLNGTSIEWINKWKYLGVTLVHGPRFGCCAEETLSKFYKAVNSILRVDGRSDDLVMLRLLESHCVPILSYSIEVLHVADRRQRSRLRVAYNSIFRKLFHYSWRESVTDLQHALGRPTWEEMTTNRQSKFFSKFADFPADSLIRIMS